MPVFPHRWNVWNEVELLKRGPVPVSPTPSSPRSAALVSTKEPEPRGSKRHQHQLVAHIMPATKDQHQEQLRALMERRTLTLNHPSPLVVPPRRAAYGDDEADKVTSHARMREKM